MPYAFNKKFLNFEPEYLTDLIYVYTYKISPD